MSVHIQHCPLGPDRPADYGRARLGTEVELDRERGVGMVQSIQAHLFLLLDS